MKPRKSSYWFHKVTPSLCFPSRLRFLLCYWTCQHWGAWGEQTRIEAGIQVKQKSTAILRTVISKGSSKLAKAEKQQLWTHDKCEIGPDTPYLFFFLLPPAKLSHFDNSNKKDKLSKVKAPKHWITGQLTFNVYWYDKIKVTWTSHFLKHSIVEQTIKIFSLSEKNLRRTIKMHHIIGLPYGKCCI